MSIDGRNIDMLFVLPEYFGKCIGKEFVTSAIENYDVKYVDVNKHNPVAVGFYK